MDGEVVLRRTDVPAVFTDQMHMARMLSDSDLLPRHLRGKPANVLVILQGARALDVAGFWALQSMHVVDGRLGMAAELMRALVIRAGHQFRVIERTMDRAVVEIKRADKDRAYRAEFTWQDAKDAELTGKDNWRKYRKSMLVARATSIAVRDECADVMFGVVYTPDELGAVTDEEGAPVIEGVAVEPFTDEEILAYADALASTPLEELPALWGTVVDHASTDAPLPGTEDTLTDCLAARLAVEIAACNTKADVRLLWEIGQACRVMTLAIDRLGETTDEGLPFTKELGELLRELGAALPEEAPQPPPEETQHAREMKAAAAASWEDVQQSAQDQVFADLREARLAKEARAQQEAEGTSTR